MFFATTTFTIIHVIISLAGIASGFVVIDGFLKAKRLDGWNAFFLIMTVLTSVTGFLFPRNGVTPGQIVGAISLALLAVAVLARYPLHFSGAGRWLYVIAAIIAQYFNFAVLIIQSFQKVGPLKDLAPTQSEPPFLVAQVAALVLFVVLAIFSLRNTARGATA
jgi:lysylphosphatidylglycerol synthetase-like protein (DUF2156 family)